MVVQMLVKDAVMVAVRGVIQPAQIVVDLVLVIHIVQHLVLHLVETLVLALVQRQIVLQFVQISVKTVVVQDVLQWLVLEQ